MHAASDTPQGGRIGFTIFHNFKILNLRSANASSRSGKSWHTDLIKISLNLCVHQLDNKSTLFHGHTFLKWGGSRAHLFKMVWSIFLNGVLVKSVCNSSKFGPKIVTYAGGLPLTTSLL